MVRERAYSDEERRLEQEERRPESRWPYEPDWERRRWEMAKGSAEREYGEPGQADYGPGRRPAPGWMQPGPYRGRGPKGYTRNDETIREDISERLMEHGQIDASEIEVEVREGVVLLRGYVNSRYAKRAAEDIAESVPGVKDVQNQLRVAEYRQSMGMGAASASAGREEERVRREPAEAKEEGVGPRG